MASNLSHSRRPSSYQFIALALILVTLGIYGIYRARADTIYIVPTSIAADCSRPVESELNAFIQNVPDGSTIQFVANGCYKQDNKIQLTDRRNLIIDGNGSTFKTTAAGTNKPVNGNWIILRGFNITLKNMTSIGAFTAYAGQPRSLATISPDPNYTEANPNYGIYGADTVYLTDDNAYSPWGDGVTTAPDEYIDGSTPDYAKNVFIKRMHAKTTSRMCWGPTSGTNIWIEDSLCEDAWYGGLDAELDTVNQPLQGLHILRNTFNGFDHLGIFVPVAADSTIPTQDIEIRFNHFLTLPDSQCSPPIGVGGYAASNPNLFHNIIVEDNDMKSNGVGVAFDHVSGGSIQRNKVEYAEVGCSYPNASPATKLTNSSAVTVADNGPSSVPNSPVADQTSPPNQTPPPAVTPIAPSSPTPTPSNSTTPKPGDVNHDGKVDGADLSAVLRLYGTNDPLGDANGDGRVNGQDLSIVLRLYGT